MERDAKALVLFESYLQQLNRPHPVDFATFCARYPAYSKSLRRLWMGMQLIELLVLEDGEVKGRAGPS